ncbi:Lipid droplet-associated hydrolase [Blattella germanica]|nr:Lipid droplet-associated hydrolase [Blattella germanica]
MTSKMTDGYVDVNGTPTYVITWGKWVEDKLDDSTEEIILLITGNPGLADYYIPFLTKLHSQLGIPIWAVSLAGHVLPPAPSDQRLPSWDKDPELYNLNGQVKHKMLFIEKYVPPHLRMIMLGHSIGAKMIIEVLRNTEIRSRVTKTYLLFPTIERMAESTNGKLMTGVIKHILPVIFFLSWFFNLLPLVVKKFLVGLQFIVRRIPTYHVAPTLKLINPTVIQNVFYLALDEMEKVKDLDDKLISELGKILFLYYGTTDGWVPVTYWKDMTQNHPEVESTLCTKKIDHAFVLRYSNEMADILTDLINEHRQCS